MVNTEDVEYVSGHSLNILLSVAGDRNSSMVLLYIVYYDDISKASVMRWHQTYPLWTLPVQVKATVFFESIAYLSVLAQRYDEWENKLFVGIIPFSFMNKIGKDIMLHFGGTGMTKLITPSLTFNNMKMLTYDLIPFYSGPPIAQLMQQVRLICFT